MTFSVYAQRRAHFARQMLPGAIAIIPTAPEQSRNRDSDFLYRHDSYFYYLTGFTEPNATLVLFASGKSVLFCQPKDETREIWDGYRLGPQAAPQTLGVDHAFSSDVIDSEIPTLLENTHAIYYPFATHVGLEGRIHDWLEKVRRKARQGISCPSQQHDACLVLDAMRLIKDNTEIDTMRRAAQISARAHVRAMRYCAQRLRQQLTTREFHLDAELLHEFRTNGSQYPAYNSIVAAGSNACVLHYRADAGLINNGDLVLIDAGCELDGYASDITRTFPANGTFSPAQRALYDLVESSQQAAISAVRTGNTLDDVHSAAVKVLAQGMLDEGLLNRQHVGNLDDVIEKRAYLPFYMHRTSHWLGMDVHDCGNYNQSLQAGMVLTVEPGIYVRPSSQVPPHFHNIGIRIEDDVLVTPTGYEILSRDVPVKAHEIEALMQNPLA